MNYFEGLCGRINNISLVTAVMSTILFVVTFVVKMLLMAYNDEEDKPAINYLNCVNKFLFICLIVSTSLYILIPGAMS